MYNCKIKIVSLCFLILVSYSLNAASLPPESYGQEQFEGFPDQFNQAPILGDVDPDAPYMSEHDPCPCPIALGGPCSGTLVVDPYDGDGLTCDNPTCPCHYYVTDTWIDGMFLGFPIPLNNELIALLFFSLLYTLWLRFKMLRTKDL